MRKTQKNKILLIFLFMLCIALLILLINKNDRPSEPIAIPEEPMLNVLVMDVGHGDSILITLGTGETMLIDAAKKSEQDTVIEELNERGITRIDILVATHPHADHIGGMAAIIDQYNIGTFYKSDEESSTKKYEKMMDTLEDHDIPIVEAYAGLSFSLGDAACTIVSPEKDVNDDPNNESVVILLDYYDAEFLFAGDMEEDAEEHVLDAGYNIDADVLKVAHHGSSTSTSEDFLQAVSPDFAVISCGENDKYGHPHKEVTNLLNAYRIPIYRTDLLGDILFVSDGYDIEVSFED